MANAGKTVSFGRKRRGTSAREIDYDTSQLTAAFLVEAQEHVAVLERVLGSLERGARDPEMLGALHRAAHSIKGSGAMLGFAAVSSFAREVEQELARIRSGAIEVTAARIDALQRETVVLRTMLDEIEHARR